MNVFLFNMIFSVLLALGSGSTVSGTNDEITNLIKEAMLNADAGQLAQLFGETVEISFDGEKSDYSRTQAEFVMRDFFQKNTPNDFKYIHKGVSKNGIQYAIAEYNSPRQSYRVYMLVKKKPAGYFIDTIDITRK
ncbi:MAG: DUF4783 domain-containing protein [Bacteroidia bacterium]|nr:DUF4783 domain-containing protein [Bacteroidia bacterium]